MPQKIIVVLPGKISSRLKVNLDGSVLELKRIFEEKFNISCDSHKVEFKGKEITENDSKLRDLNIRKGSFIFLRSEVEAIRQRKSSASLFEPNSPRESFSLDNIDDSPDGLRVKTSPLETPVTSPQEIGHPNVPIAIVSSQSPSDSPDLNVAKPKEMMKLKYTQSVKKPSTKRKVGRSLLKSQPMASGQQTLMASFAKSKTKLNFGLGPPMPPAAQGTSSTSRQTSTFPPPQATSSSSSKPPAIQGKASSSRQTFTQSFPEAPYKMRLAPPHQASTSVDAVGDLFSDFLPPPTSSSLRQSSSSTSDFSSGFSSGFSCSHSSSGGSGQVKISSGTRPSSAMGDRTSDSLLSLRTSSGFTSSSFSSSSSMPAPSSTVYSSDFNVHSERNLLSSTRLTLDLSADDDEELSGVLSSTRNFSSIASPYTSPTTSRNLSTASPNLFNSADDEPYPLMDSGDESMSSPESRPSRSKMSRKDPTPVTSSSPMNRTRSLPSFLTPKEMRVLKERERRKYRIEHHLCRECAVSLPKDDVRQHCNDCRLKIQQRSKKCYPAWMAKMNADPERNEKRLEKSRSYKNKTRAERIENQQCTVCKAPLEGEDRQSNKCRQCTQLKTIQNANLQERYVSEGLCRICGKLRENQRFKECNKCKQHDAERYYNRSTDKCVRCDDEEKTGKHFCDSCKNSSMGKIFDGLPDVNLHENENYNQHYFHSMLNRIFELKCEGLEKTRLELMTEAEGITEELIDAFKQHMMSEKRRVMSLKDGVTSDWRHRKRDYAKDASVVQVFFTSNASTGGVGCLAEVLVAAKIYGLPGVMKKLEYAAARDAGLLEDTSVLLCNSAHALGMLTFDDDAKIYMPAVNYLVVRFY